MKTSSLGLAILTSREGFRLEAYQDIRGIWTIGVGHTAAAGPPHPYPGLTLTKEQVETVLASDVVPVETGIIAALPNIGLTQNEFDALVSLVFNIGIGGFRGSSVRRYLLQHNYAGAADDFLMWDHPPQLIGRRREERAQFLTPDTITGA